MRRPRSTTPPRAALIAGGAAAAAALGAVGTRLARRGGAGGALAALSGRRASEEHERAAETGEPQTYDCPECGTSYRVSGTDRHRLYWPADASEDDPVLDHRCVTCGTPLPGGRGAPVG